MKHSLLTLIISASFFCLSAQTYNITGVVKYKNQGAPVLLNDCIVTAMQNNNPVATDTTDCNGLYSLDNLQPGTYQIVVSCSKPAGGFGGATDALLIMRHFVGLPPLLSGLNLAAADVSASGYANTGDCVMIESRFVGFINSFPSGDWIFDHPTLSITSSNVIQDIEGLCFGDVNGSYSPPHCK